MDFAASSVLRSASTLLISGFAAPARTTMPISERARLCCRRAPIPACRARRRPSIQDHDVRGLASREPGGNRLWRIAHRWTARRDQAVTACALESRAQLGIDSIKTGGDHHTHVGRGCSPHHQNGGDAKRRQPVNKRASFHAAPPAGHAVGAAGSCARAASGQAAAPPSNEMSSRRFIRSPRRRGRSASAEWSGRSWMPSSD